MKIADANLGTTVTFGGVPVQGKFFAGNPTLYLSAPAHAAGTVDVVVSGQNGQLLTLTDAYTYVSPLTFDFNGDWAGYGETDQDGPLFFTIRNNLLLSVSCGPDVTLTLSPPRPVTNGEFSVVGDGRRLLWPDRRGLRRDRNHQAWAVCIYGLARQEAIG